MALQVSLSTFARLALTTVDYAFLGHLDTAELAAASLSTMWANMPLMMIWGGCGALTTLCGQAHGTKNGELVGVWLQMGIVMATILSAPLFACYWFVELPLLSSTDDPEVIRLGTRFARITSFAPWPALVYVCIRVYLQSMSIMAPVTVVGTVSISVAISANYFLIYGCFGRSGLDFDGSPLATVIATWFQPIALVMYCVLYKKMHLEAWSGWDLSAFTADCIKAYANLAIPIAISSLIADVAASGLALIATKLGSDVIAANAAISGLWGLSWALFWGFGCATQIRVASCLDANRPQAAKVLSKLRFICTVACVALLAAITLSLGETFFQLYTTNDDLLKLCVVVQPIFVVRFMIESVEMLASSVLNAMGKAKIVAWTSSLAIWCIELPMAYAGAIMLGYGLPALWYSVYAMEMARIATENMEVADMTERKLEEDALNCAMEEGGNALPGLNTVPRTALTLIPTPSSVSSHQWGDEVL